MTTRTTIPSALLGACLLVPLAAPPALASRPAPPPPVVDTRQLTTLGTFVSDDGRFTIGLRRGAQDRLRLVPVPRPDGRVDAGFLRQEYRTSWGWVTGTIYFDKRETALLRSASAAAWLAGFLPPPFNSLVPMYAHWISVTAGVAVYRGRCVFVRSNGLVGSYAGSWCSGSY